MDAQGDAQGWMHKVGYTMWTHKVVEQGGWTHSVDTQDQT